MSSTGKALFCFEFFVEAIEFTISPTVNVETLKVKFNDYDWVIISQEQWKNVGRRCYLINEANFLEQIQTSKLRVQAICSDKTIYSSDVSFGSFNVAEDSASCKGLMKLYAMDKSPRNLCMHVAIRVFNVDRVHPAVFQQSVLAVDRKTQTEWYRTDIQVQTSRSLRHAAVQTKQCKSKSKQTQVMERHVETVDAAIQPPSSTMILKKEFEKAVADMIVQKLLAAKIKKHQPKQIVKKQSQNNRNPSRFDSRLSSSKILEKNDNSLERSPNPKNQLKQCSRSIRDNYQMIGYNAVSREQLLRTLDRLIAQKKATLWNLRTSKSANSADDSGSGMKTKRLCRTAIGSETPESRMKSRPIVTDKLLINDQQFSRSVQELQLGTSKNFPRSNTTIGTSTNTSERTTSSKSQTSNLKSGRNLPIEQRNLKNAKMGDKNGRKESNAYHYDNQSDINNDNDDNSEAHVVSTERSSDPLTVSELESIK